MSEPFLGEIRMISFNFASKGWALCNGQTMGIAQNTALFSLLGTSYGGDGQTTFMLPNLQGRVPVHFHPDGAPGGVGGEENHLLLVTEAPSHTHQLTGSSLSPGQASPVIGMWPSGGTFSEYAASSDGSTMSPATMGVTGGLPHPNLPPYQVINFAIALVGIFPSQN